MDYATYNDEALIRFIQQSQPDALSALYDRYGRLVFSIALHLLGDRRTAEEITLDVFSQVWQKANLYRAERASVRVWLTSMARHKAIDTLRRESVRPQAHSLDWADLYHNSLTVRHNPERETQLALQREQIQAAVASLPPEQQEALTLAFFGGLSHSEIAQRLDLPLGTVKTRIRLALEKLGDRLEEV
jgi:RNA polymerase sigma-70 factor, ECF subfamily